MAYNEYLVPTSASPWNMCDTVDGIGTWTWECPPGVATENAVRDFTFTFYATFEDYITADNERISGSGSISVDVHISYAE